MWTSILGKLKEIWTKMLGSKTIQESLNVAPLISKEMEAAINLWSSMYINKAPWIKEPDAEDPVRIVSLGLPALIATEKARMVLLEFQSEITTPTEEVEVENPNYQEPIPDDYGNIIPSSQPPKITEEKPIGDTVRAEFLNKQYTKLKEKLRQQLEYGIAKGGLVIKPRIVMNPVLGESDEETNETTATIEFDFIQADNFFPIAFDANGNITEAAFVQAIQDKTTIYSRLEYHKFKGNSVQIINKAYKSTDTSVKSSMNRTLNLGKEIPLSDVPQWKDLQEKTTVKNVMKPLFAYFKMPDANTIDTTSPLGVSGYSRVTDLIKDADMQYSRLLWEYEAGEMAIDIDRDAIKFQEGENGQGGHSIRPYLQNRLFRKIDISSTGDTYQPYAPTLRDAQYIQGLNTILMRIEDVCGISRGTLSDAAAEARTATELKILKQRSYCSNAEIQHALENALKDVIYVMNVYCDLYEITPDGDYDTSFEWDDSILVDVETELNKKIVLMQNGLMSKLEVREWYFGETERQAQEALLKIENETMQNMENELVMQENAQKEELQK